MNNYSPTKSRPQNIQYRRTHDFEYFVNRNNTCSILNNVHK